MEYHVRMISVLTDSLKRGNREAIEKRIAWHKEKLRSYGVFAI